MTNVYNKQSYSPCVYGIGIHGDVAVKIGVSLDPERRCDHLQTAHYNDYFISFLSNPTKRAYQIERLLHRHFKDAHLGGEWFLVTPDELSAAFNTYLRKEKDKPSPPPFRQRKRGRKVSHCAHCHNRLDANSPQTRRYCDASCKSAAAYQRKKKKTKD